MSGPGTEVSVQTNGSVNTMMFDLSDKGSIDKTRKRKKVDLGHPKTVLHYVDYGEITMSRFCVCVIGGVIDECRKIPPTKKWLTMSIARLVPYYKLWAADRTNPNIKKLSDAAVKDRIRAVIDVLTVQHGKIIKFDNHDELLNKTTPIAQTLLESLYVKDSEKIPKNKKFRRGKGPKVGSNSCFRWASIKGNITPRRFVLMALGDLIDLYRNSKTTKSWLNISSEKALEAYGKVMAAETNPEFLELPKEVALECLDNVISDIASIYPAPMLQASHMYLEKTIGRVTEEIKKSLPTYSQRALDKITTPDDIPNKGDDENDMKDTTTVISTDSAADDAHPIVQIVKRELMILISEKIDGAIAIDLLDSDDFDPIMSLFEDNLVTLSKVDAAKLIRLDEWLRNITKGFIGQMVKCKIDEKPFKLSY